MESIVVSVVIAVIIAFVFLIFRDSPIISFIFWTKTLDPVRHGGELVAEVLKHHKVKNIFTLIGGHISPVVVAAEKAGIRVIDTRHEVTTVFAADAVSRLTDTIGVAVVTAGPGVTNTITAVKNAQMAQSPVLLIGGAAPTLLKGRGALQDIDQLSLFKSICKYCKSVETVRDIIPVIRKAIYIAKSDTPGPVFVELPVNVLYPLDVVQKEVGQSKGGKSLFSWIIKWYLDWHVYNIFVDGFKAQDTAPLTVTESVAGDRQVGAAMKLLLQSQKPVLILGSQAVQPAMSANLVRNAINQLGIPCFLGGMSRGLLETDSLFHLRHTRREVLKEADLVILAGAICDFRLSYGKILSRSSKIITVNRNKSDMLMNSDVFWKPTLSIKGSVSDFIIRLAMQKGEDALSFDEKWIDSAYHRDCAKEIQNREKAEEMSQDYLNPMKVLYGVNKSLNHNTVVIVDGGDFAATASYIVRPQCPLQWLDPGPFGTLGVGAGFAIGAKLCNPDSDVLILYGDGSLGYSLMEFDTFVRHKLPVRAVVGNNACWEQISREQLPRFRSDVGCSLRYSDYHNAVEAIGGRGFLVEAKNENNLKEILTDSVFLSRAGSSVLVNALISKSSFREGSISV